MRFMIASLCVVLGTALAGAATAADVVPVPVMPVKASKFTVVEGITEYRLPNGLRVLLAPDASKPSTTVNITYMVGSRHENYGETGMAHLLEHLVFKGTPSLPGKTIVEEFARRGMRMNGSTFYDRTNYFETFAASDDNLDWALTMEADRMVNSFIARSDLDSEMTVVRNEMEMGENNPERILWERMTASAYQWHNYGKTTIGARTDVEQVKIENLQSFYRTYYQPDNATLIVTGKFDEARTLAHIEKTFGAIPRPTRVLPHLYTLDPPQDGPREVTIHRVGDSYLMGTLYHIPPGAHPDSVYMELLAFVLGDTPTGRLHRALVDKKKIAGLSADSMALHDPGFFAVFANLNKAQSIAEAKKIMIDVIEGVKKSPITEAELQRAKKALLNDFDKALSNPVSFGIGLSESVAKGDWRLYFLRRDRIEQASLADVQRVAESYLIESNRTYGQFIPTETPQRAVLPLAPQLDTLLANYQGKAAVAEGEVFDPNPKNIEQRTERFTLPNGMQAALLRKATRGNTVNGTIALRMGDENSLFGQREVAQAVAHMLLRGTKTLNRQQIADRLDELKAKLSASTTDGNTVILNFETRRAHLAETLALIGDILRNPGFAADEFEKFRTEWITSIEEQRRQPEAVAHNELARHGNPYKKGDVRYASSFAEQIASFKAIKLQSLKAFHQRFYGANAGQIALVGDFDPETTQDALKTGLGNWKSTSSFTRVPVPLRNVPGAVLRFETPDKANACYMAGLALPLKDDAPDAPALALANRVLGGGGLKSRMADRLRQKDGISYGAGSALHLNPYEPNSDLLLYAIYAPQNLEKLKTGLAEELGRFVQAGITEQELVDAKNGILQGQLLHRSQDASLAGSLVNQLFLGRTMQFVADYEARLKDTTLAQVNATIVKYIDPSRLVQVLAGDFAHAAKTHQQAAE